MRRIRPVACLVLPIAVLPARGPRGEDTALVPLEGDAREVQEAAEHIAAGRFREGVAMLQGLVAPEASRKAEAYLVEVPATLPREAGALGDALRAASAKGSPARPLALPAPRARGGLGLPMARLPPPSPGPAAGRRFLPVEEVAAHLLSSLRGEALEAYRELYDGLGASLLAEHRERDDPARLERAARNLFWTSSGDDAAEILGDSCFERGAYAEAARWWRRILSEHPAPDVPIGRVRAKLLVALRALGAEKEETLERDRLLAASPGDAGLVREIEAAVPRTTPGGRPPPEEPSRWGGEVRDALPPALPGAAGGGPHLASAPLQLSWASWAWSGQGLERSLEPGLGRPGRFHGRGVPPDAPGHFPFVALADGDDVYLSGVFSLYRFDGRPGGGKLLREYRKPVSSIDVLAYQERAENDSGLYTVTLWKKALEPSPSLAALPGEVLVTHYVSDRVSAKKYLGYYIYREIPIRSLVAFDAATGRALWKTGSAARPPRAAGEAGGRAGRGALEPADEWEGLDDEDLPFPGFPRGFRPRSPLELDDPESAISRDFSYTSPAIVRGGLVVAGGWFQRGYVNTALRALDLRTGELVWETLLSGAQVEPTMFGEMAREPLAGAIHEADGTVYYVNQMGVAAAADLRTGRLRWLATYDSIELEATFYQEPVLRDLVWGPSPLLLLGHVLVLAPRDSAYLYALDTGRGPAGPAAGGKVLWRHGASDGGLRDLLGFHRGLLYFTGSSQGMGPGEITALDLRGMDAYGNLPPDGGGDGPRRAASLRCPGRIPSAGVLTSSGVLFADEEGLKLADLDLTGIRDLSPGPFPPPSDRGTYPGRLQVAGGLVLMTSRSILSAHAPAAEGPAR